MRTKKNEIEDEVLGYGVAAKREGTVGICEDSRMNAGMFVPA